MRATTAAACCVLALLLVTLPAQISAAASDAEAATSNSGRQLLVVVVKDDVAATSSDNESQPVSGSAASAVGADFNPPELETKSTPASVSAATDTTQEAPLPAAKQQARRRRQQQQQGRTQQQQQQQRALGRKGGPQQRQATGGDDIFDCIGDDGVPRVFVGDLDDYVLPFCQPTEGVVCSDRDKTALLKAQPAIISLENAYPYAQVKPAASYAGSSVTTLDFLGDTFTNRNQGVTKAALETLAGTEAGNSDTTVTTTALQGTVDASRADRAIPDSVSVVADRTAAEGTYEWKSWRPRFTYQAGANYGLPVGLATVTDTSGK